MTTRIMSAGSKRQWGPQPRVKTIGEQWGGEGGALQPRRCRDVQKMQQEKMYIYTHTYVYIWQIGIIEKGI